METALSAERLLGYVSTCGGDRRLAIKRYERNTSLSEALYGVVQGFEVALRNALTSAIATSLGSEWYHGFPLRAGQRAAVEEASQKISRAGKLVSPSRVVANLTFGFWASLVGPHYEKTLWVKHLHRAFPHAKQTLSLSNGEQRVVTIPRARIAERIDSIKALRNRIAHHEPILLFATEQRYCEILEATAWICPTTSAWIALTNCFLVRLNDR